MLQWQVLGWHVGLFRSSFRGHRFDGTRWTIIRTLVVYLYEARQKEIKGNAADNFLLGPASGIVDFMRQTSQPLGDHTIVGVPEIQWRLCVR